MRGALRSSTGRSSIGGEVSVGHCGVNRTATSATVARSVTTSAAGGSEVNDAATKSTVAPRPNSTSAKRRNRVRPAVDTSGRRRTMKKFAAPRPRSPASATTFVKIMVP